MKKIKKILFCLTLVFLLTINLNVKASSILSNIDETIIEKYGVNYSHMDVEINGSNKNVNMFSMKTDGVNSKLVTWAKQASDGTGIITSTLTSIASDYEKKHPGWIVVAGINADQWYYERKATDQGGYFWVPNQSYYPFTMDGQNLFTINPLGGSGNGIAITNDSDNPLISVTNSLGIELQIYDNNDNLIGVFEVSGYNKNPNENETTVWCGYIKGVSTSKNIETINDLYIVEKAEFACMNNSSEYPTSNIYNPTDSFYGRGEITNIANKATIGKSQFAIETTDELLKEQLKKGVKVIIEQQYSPKEANNVESVTGYHTKHISNGKVLSSTAEYNTASKPRSIFGTKEDGTYFLMTTRDASEKSTGGTKYDETNELLKYYGAYNAYQDDGGGSVTAIYRNEWGEFDVVSESVDSSEQRTIFSGLLFVMREPGFSVSINDSTASSITLTKNNSDFTKEISNVSIIINNQSIDVEEDKVVIKGLEENTEYKIVVKYTYNNQEVEGIIYGKTQKYSPGLDISTYDNYIKITRRTTDEILKTVAATFTINNRTYEMEDVDEFVIDGLIKSSEYRIVYTYKVLNIQTNKIFERTSEEIIIKTVSYEIPKIIEFEAIKNEKRSRITIDYEYTDGDKLVLKAYILVNDKEYVIEKKYGNLTIDNVDFKNYTYDIRLYIEYETPEGKMKELKSSLITLEKEIHNHEWADATCTTPKTCKTCGATEGEALGHSWKDATCTTPKTCEHCYETEGEALGHEWVDATIDTPKTCNRCHITEGDKLQKKGCNSSSIIYCILGVNSFSVAMFLVLRKK